jgi:ABC-type glycerol-3-phosphate transport system permease component
MPSDSFASDSTQNRSHPRGARHTIGFFEEVPIELEEAAMITLPVVLMVRAGQRQFIRGLAIGGVKG